MSQIIKCFRCNNTDVTILNQHNVEADFNYSQNVGDVHLKCFCDKCGYNFTRRVIFNFHVIQQYDEQYSG